MKARTEKKLWSLSALFVIMLILTLPVYSAQSLAAVNVQITKNEGQNEIDGFINADGDVWTVEAIISGSVLEVSPEDVYIDINGNEANFDSCADSDLGPTCKYVSPLIDGVKENTYAFNVVYKYLDELGYTLEKSNADSISADGSAPVVVGTINLNQNVEDGNVDFSFEVTDQFVGKPSIGIKTIEIIDADTNSVLKTLGPFPIGTKTFNFAVDGGTNGQLSGSLFSGDGAKRLKIRAEDHLGHQQTSPSYYFEGDFIKPEIQEMELVHFGKFIGQYIYPSDIRVYVQENNLLEDVVAYSDQADLNGESGSCVDDQETKGLKICTWKNVDIDPESQISIKFIATDNFGNIAEKTLSQSFTKDEMPPKALFFGSERVYDNVNYVKDDEQIIILDVQEQGAGILTYDEEGNILGTDGIRANLDALGGGNGVEPTCNATSQGAKCYWRTTKQFTSDGNALVLLNIFKDNVGNDGEANPIELVVDNSGPVVKSLELFGGEKEYFQSNDQIKIVMEVEETSGLVVLVNMNNVVADAETEFPENIYTDNLYDNNGWQVFTQDDCERSESKWICEFYTKKIKSGPENNLPIRIKVQDTAGNDVAKDDWPTKFRSNLKFNYDSNYKQSVISVDLLGLADENAPDYWEVGEVRPLISGSPFIDLDLTPLIYTRIPFTIDLDTTNSKARALEIKLIGCTASDEDVSVPVASALTTDEDTEDAIIGSATETPIETPTSSSPTISRAILYSGVDPVGEINPSPEIILEFDPFDGREMFNLKESGGEGFTTHVVDYNCKLQIYSRVGKTAINTGEIQDVKVSVPFGFSVMGSKDESLAKAIKKARAEAGSGFFGVIGKLEMVMKWLYYISQLASTIVGAVQLVNTIKLDLVAPYKVELTKPAAIAACFGLDTVVNRVGDSVNWLSIPINILSCNPTGVSWMKWYDEWLGVLPKYYNELLQIEVLNVPELGDALKPTGEERRKVSYAPARSVRDNFYLSIAGVCLPGLIHNLDKYRQIKCRKVVCLENEVAQGLTTIHGCNELDKLLTCKYFIGELWYLFPFSQFFDKVTNMLKSAARDPVSAIHTANVLGCGLACLSTGGEISYFCQVTNRIWDTVDWIVGVISFFTTVIQDIKAGGLQYCDSVGL